MAASSSSSSLAGFYATPPTGSDQFRSYMLQQGVSQLYRTSPDDLHFHDQEPVRSAIYLKDYKRSSLAAQSIISDFQREMDQYNSREQLVFRSMDATSVGMQIALATCDLPIALMVPIVAIGMEWLKQPLQEMHATAAKNKLAMRLAQYRSEHGNLSAFELPPSDDLGRKRYDLIFNADHPVLDPAFEHVPQESQAIVQGTMIQMLADIQVVQGNNDRLLFSQMADLGDQLKLQGEKTQVLDNQLVQVNRAFLEFRDTTSTHLQIIDHNIQEINGSLHKINERLTNNEEQIRLNAHDNVTNRILIAKNQEDIRYMQGYLFGKMDPKEQLEALHKGLFDGMPHSERQDLEDKITAAQKRQELMGHLSDFANGASELLALADKLELPISKELRGVVAVGTQALNVGLSIASGNYIGAIVGFTGMLGIGKKQVDIGAKRHEQVMTALSELAQGQHAILQKQDLLLKWSAYLDSRVGQVLEAQKVLYAQMVEIEKKVDTIIKNQEVLFQNVLGIAKALEEHHRIMMEQFAGIVNRLVIIRLEIRSVALEGVSNCCTAVTHMYRHPGYIKQENRFQSYAQLLDYYDYHSKFCLPEGLRGLLSKLANVGKETDVNFLLPASLDYSVQRGEQESAILYFNDFVRFSFDVVQKDAQKIFLSSLINPVDHSSFLTEKIAQLNRVKPEQWLPMRLRDVLDPSRSFDPVEIEKLINKLYSPHVVLCFAEYAFRLHYFLDLFKGDIGSELYQMDELRDKIAREGGLSSVGKDLLEGAILRLDVAIAQQSLLSGDYLLEQLLPLFYQGRTADNQELYDTMIEKFNNNYMLAHNFIVHAFASKIGIDQFVLYEVSYNNEGSCEDLRQLLGVQWHFVIKERRWHIEIGVYNGANSIPIPTPQEVLKGEFIISHETKKLLGMRKTLIEELVRYDFVTNKHLFPFNREMYMRALAANV